MKKAMFYKKKKKIYHIPILNQIKKLPCFIKKKLPQPPFLFFIFFQIQSLKTVQVFK